MGFSNMINFKQLVYGNLHEGDIASHCRVCYREGEKR